MDIIGDLEHQPAKWLVRIGLAGDLGPLFGMVPDHGGLVERARQIRGDGVQQALHADVAEARPAQHRMDQARQRCSSQRGHNLGFGQLGPLEVGHVGFREDLVIVGQSVEHFLTPELGLGQQVGRDLDSVMVEPRSSVL